MRRTKIFDATFSDEYYYYYCLFIRRKNGLASYIGILLGTAIVVRGVRVCKAFWEK